MHRTGCLTYKTSSIYVMEVDNESTTHKIILGERIILPFPIYCAEMVSRASCRINCLTLGELWLHSRRYQCAKAATKDSQWHHIELN